MRALARRAGIGSDFALLLLQDAGIAVKRPQDHIAPRQLHSAEAALDLIELKPRRVAPPEPTPSKQAPPEKAQKPASREKPRERSKSKRRPPELPIIGRRQEISHIGYGAVEAIHWGLVEEFGRSRDPIDPPGIRSEDLLHSALTRCSTGLGEDRKYPTATMAGAALLHSIINNHPFHNGNKRTGIVALLVMLDQNGWRLHAEDDELFDFLLRVSAHDLIPGFTAENKPESDAEVVAIAEWLNQRLRRIEFLRPSLKWHDLKGILSRHDCAFQQPRRGNRLNIYRGDRHSQVWFGGDNRDVRAGEIPKIRKELELDPEHGVDDDVFFDATEKLPAFVAKYRKLLERLAKV